jgi:hypothetical protein
MFCVRAHPFLSLIAATSKRTVGSPNRKLFIARVSLHAEPQFVLNILDENVPISTDN